MVGSPALMREDGREGGDTYGLFEAYEGKSLVLTGGLFGDGSGREDSAVSKELISACMCLSVLLRGAGRGFKGSFWLRRLFGG